jgi:stage IV sporulation protein B
MPLSFGYVTDVVLDGVQRGSSGRPGELKGRFQSGKRGKLLKNTPQGVFGVFSEFKTEGLQRLPVAKSTEVQEGDAILYCTVNDRVNAYRIRISKLDLEPNLKNFVVEVTDPKLIEATGGIVQGMSGSPIVQNGKIIGAVTHVFVNDPTKGYGIFIENMLANMATLLPQAE